MMIIPIDILLTWGATYKKLAAGETLFREGTPGNFYYQVVTGSIRWVNVTEDGKEFIQGMIEPGESCGELPLFDDLPYVASAIANKETLILRLHKNSFQQLLKEEPDLHFAFSRLMAQRMRFKFLLLKELAFGDPEHRISCLLNYFKESHKYICADCNQLLLTRQQIADMTGLRVETVIRTMKNLAQKGSLVIDKGKVYY
jgi:CRP-like cAMP-binding protein